MNNIKIFRLKTGEDLITFFEETEKSFTFIHPISFFINYNLKKLTQELVLNFWLPMNVIEENRITIDKSEIFFQLSPKNEFKEYYLNFLDGIEKNTDKTINKDFIKNLLQSVDAKHFNKVH
jgi:hypothetical protein